MTRTRKRTTAVAVVAAAAVVLFLLLLPARPLLARVSFSRVFLDRDGGLLRIMLTEDEKYRVYHRLGEFPPEMIEAILFQEDRWFWIHPGFNPVTLVKAFQTTYIRKERRAGGSTITMQLARMVYRINSRTIPGKIRQILAANWLEIRYSKREILEAYLNLVPCGGNIEGYPAAAWYYYRRDIASCSLSEILLLSVIPQDPLDRAPSAKSQPEELLRAREILFVRWVQEHPEDASSALEIALPLAVYADWPFQAPHLTDYLHHRITPEQRTVKTTLDPSLQLLTEREIARYLNQVRGKGVNNTAVGILDWTTMELVACVGSSDYFNYEIEGQVNGTAAKRSPGSTLKPFIYALAMEQGLIHPETMLKDAPTSFNEYTPDNYHKDFVGPIKAWRALVDSRNIPAIVLADQLHDPDLYDLLSCAGVSGLKDKGHYGLSIVLGSAEVTLLELLRLYAVLPNQGKLKGIRMIQEEGSSESLAVLSPESCWITLDMLEKNPPPIETRPRYSEQSPVAWKTGTSIGFKDGWAIGVVDRYVIAVWVGNFDGYGNPAFNGRTTAGPLLFRIAYALLADIPRIERLPHSRPPQSLRRVEVCEVSGAIPGPHCRRKMLTWYIPGVSPIAACSIHREIHIDTRTGYRTDEPVGPYVKKEVREFWPTDLLALFEEAGLPRIIPPEYPPEQESFSTRDNGFKPRILSPLGKTTYVVRDYPDRNRILTLAASADADAGTLFWFANDRFLGRTSPKGQLFWEPEPGLWMVTVLDSRGRADSVEIRVARSE